MKANHWIAMLALAMSSAAFAQGYPNRPVKVVVPWPPGQATDPAANAKEFVARVKANPNKYTFASSGTGATAHLFAEQFNSMAQIKARHVPYKASASALTDLIGGQVD